MVGLCAATVGILSTPLIASARPGAAASAPHVAAAAPHYTAPAPHYTAAAPHVAAAAPHFSTPAPHFTAPAQYHAAQMPASRSAAPHSFAMTPASHTAAPRAMQMTAPRSAARPQMSHMAAGRISEPQMAPMGAARNIQPVSHISASRTEQRLSQFTPQKRANEIAGMTPANRTEAMLRMSPQQRAESMAHMSPSLRSQFMGKEGANRMQSIQVERSSVINHPQTRALVAAGAGAGAIGAMSAAGMMHKDEMARPSEPTGENISHERGAPGITRSGMMGRSAIPGPPGFANPRQVGRLSPGAGRQISPTRGAMLTFSPNARNIPRAGNLQTGRPGPLDPGGYVRSAGGGSSSLINPNYASRQFAAAMPNYQAIANANYTNMVANRANWPWQLPAYAPGWFNNSQSPWNWPQSNRGNNNPGGFFGMLGNLFNPWGVNQNQGWIPALNYYNGYDWDNQNYPCDYYAPNGFCPTPYLFDVSGGQFWQPGAGFSDTLPSGYQAPITVAIQEIVPTYDQSGQISGYQPQTFYYNAFWDSNAQSYGYYDYRQQFHWLTFPWLNSWSGANMQNQQISNPQSY